MEDHRAALIEIDALMSSEFNTPDGNRLDILATLVEAFEVKHFPMELPDPVDAINFVWAKRD
ncbi:hypothetical protein CFter6_2866 [Collimonas fungivorans]|uniref:Uncharacterized protein n=2 Tax=Collimonas fungivorans TaxID=158899 RepID=A0A127PCK1_9BURK|nr:hypothetical protein CFter6_2866 [Collimonas fungivorans]